MHRSIRLGRPWSLCAAAFLAVLGCARVPSVEGTFWQALDVNGTPMAEGTEPTLHLIPGAVTGSTGCNAYVSAGYRLQQDSDRVWRLEIGPLSVDSAECPNPDMAAVETAFLEKLADIEQARFDQGVLVLEGPHGRLRFEAVDEADFKAGLS